MLLADYLQREYCANLDRSYIFSCSYRCLLKPNVFSMCIERVAELGSVVDVHFRVTRGYSYRSPPGHSDAGSRPGL